MAVDVLRPALRMSVGRSTMHGVEPGGKGACSRGSLWIVSYVVDGAGIEPAEEVCPADLVP